MSETASGHTDGDYEELAARNAELESELAKATAGRGWRMTVAFVLVVLFAVGLYAANHAVWLATTALSTDQFVDTLAPLPGDPAVSAALGTDFAASVVENNDINGAVADRLPDGLTFISAPITEAVEGVIADAATRIVSSDLFTGVWERALRVTHSAVIVVLEGGPRGNLVATDGTVAIDLSGLAASVDERLTDLGIDVIDAETIEAQIVLFDGSNLGLAQWIAEIIYTVRWISPIVAVLLLGVALVVATDRRRIGWWLGVATAATMALTLIELRFLRSTIVSSISDPIRAEGVEAAWGIIVDRFVAQTWGLLALGLVAAAVTWAFGSSPRALAMRSSFDRRQASGSDSGVFGFVGSHARAVQWVAVIGGVGFLLVSPTISGLLVVVTAIIVGAIVVGAAWLSGSTQAAGMPEEG